MYSYFPSRLGPFTLTIMPMPERGNDTTESLYRQTDCSSGAIKRHNKGEILKQIKHREAQSKCFGKLAYAMKPAGAQGGVTKVEVVVEGEVIVYTKKQEVERKIQKRNPKHFNQPAGSPFTIHPLSEVGVTSTKFKTTHLADGTEVQMPVDTFLETETVLDLLKRPLPGAEKSNISSRITMMDFIGAIKAWKERTSTSPSGRHLGHYKLLVETYEDKTGSETIQAAAGQILKLMVDIMDLASDKGFILDRWTKVVNVMIYKKPGVYLIQAQSNPPLRSRLQFCHRHSVREKGNVFRRRQ
jgi:hypothetical protein